MDKLKRELCCDLCKQPINPERPWPQFVLPLTDDERETIGRAFLETLPMPVKMLGPGLLPSPKYHRFDFCQGCVDGFLPMVEELKRIALRDAVEKMRRDPKARTTAAGGPDVEIRFDES